MTVDVLYTVLHIFQSAHIRRIPVSSLSVVRSVIRFPEHVVDFYSLSPLQQVALRLLIYRT